MFKYFISTFCFLIQFSVFAQKEQDSLKIKQIENTLNVEEKIVEVSDSINPNYYPKTYGLRVGIDILKPILSFTEANFRGLEVAADWRVNSKLFVAGEAGYANKTNQEDYFNHTVKGTYIKAGINYNLFTNWLNMDNEIYLGARYGFALFTNELNNYTVYQEGNFFEPKTVTATTKYTNLNAHWVEFVAGIKVEVLTNLFLGFMINANKLITSNHPSNFRNTYSPGFGGITKNGSGANMNYTISYRIPIYKK